MASAEGTAPEPGARNQRAGFSMFVDQVADTGGRLRWETRLYHAESDAEAVFPGALPEGWIEWILARIGYRSNQPMGAPAVPSRAVLEVEAVEIVAVAVDESTIGEPRHVVTAQVVLRLTGVARIEREIGAKVLRGIARDEGRVGADE